MRISGPTFRILLLLFISVVWCTTSLSAQDEFLVYGRVKLENGTDSVSVQVRNEEKQIMDKSSEKDGNFEIFLKYGDNYTIRFSYPEYQALEFIVELKLPEGVKQCCFTPIQLNFHLFKPDGVNDALFQEPLLTVAYIEKYKNFNYDVDVDYTVHKMIVKAETDRQQAYRDSLNYEAVKDSLELEKKYMELVNRGNLLYAANQFLSAKEYFEKAYALKPHRRYPKYKLEDIKTELEIFNRKADSLGVDIDSLLPPAEPVDTLPVKEKEYRRLTDDEIEQKFLADLHRNLAKNAESEANLDSILAYAGEKMGERPRPQSGDSIVLGMTEDVAKVDSTSEPAVAREDIPVVEDTAAEPQIIIEVPDTVPEERVVAEEASDSIRPFDYKAYQDSLRKQYPTLKSIEVEEFEHKKVTRVIINKNNIVTIYLKVEHDWGGTFYFIDRTPHDPENISSTFFDIATNIEDDKQEIEISDDAGTEDE